MAKTIKHYKVAGMLSIGEKTISRGVVVSSADLDGLDIEELLDKRAISEFQIDGANAASETDKDAQIAALLREIESLKADVAARDEQLAKLSKNPETNPGTPVAEVKGIGAEIAEVLVGKGWETVESLTKVTDDELLSIPGIGEKVLKAIRKVAPHNESTE